MKTSIIMIEQKVLNKLNKVTIWDSFDGISESFTISDHFNEYSHSSYGNNQIKYENLIDRRSLEVYSGNCSHKRDSFLSNKMTSSCIDRHSNSSKINVSYNLVVTPEQRFLMTQNLKFHKNQLNDLFKQS